MVSLPIVRRSEFGDQFHQLAIALHWVLEKDNIIASLRKILIHWGLQNINTMSFTFQKSHFPKISVIWKLSKLSRLLYCMLISMSGKK